MKLFLSVLSAVAIVAVVGFIGYGVGYSQGQLVRSGVTDQSVSRDPCWDAYAGVGEQMYRLDPEPTFRTLVDQIQALMVAAEFKLAPRSHDVAINMIREAAILSATRFAERSPEPRGR